jgi:hypothetical protein
MFASKKILASTKYSRRQNAGVDKILASTKCWRQQNTHVNKMLVLTEYSLRQNVGVNKILGSTKGWCMHGSISLLFWPGRVHSSWLLPYLTDVLLYFRGREYVNWYWTVMVITFCFHHFLIGRLWADIKTAIVWRKSVKFRRTPIFCRRQNLWRFLHGGTVQQVSTVREYSVGESAHKSRAARCNAKLGDCVQRNQHHLGDKGDLQGGPGEVSCCGICRAKQ